MSAACRILLVLGVFAGSGHAASQSFHYVEPGVASCPAPPARTTATPTPVPRGVALSGTINVACGFEEGSYTVTLNATDPGATFAPKSFLVNFGSIAGNGAFTVTFSTVGVQTVAATITSNMGSPAVRGYFASAGSAFEVVNAR